MLTSALPVAGERPVSVAVAASYRVGAKVLPDSTPSVPAKPKRNRISKGKRARGVALLKQLAELEASYGEFAAHLAPAIQAVKRQTERTRMSDSERVLLAIEQGNFTKAEIMRAAGVSEWDARKILEELEDLDVIWVSRQRRPDVDAGDGVPVLLYQLTHKLL
jgi:predicted transcriptional regulator